MEKCKKCGGEQSYKNGLSRGKQRYKCKGCGHNFTIGDRRLCDDKTLIMKHLAVQLYQLGLGFRAIGRFLGVSNVTILRWVRQAAHDLPALPLPTFVRVMELDELWHYCQKKREKSGAGGQFVVIANGFLPMK